ncbi:unnamed protein product [Rotaria sp. Silwood2]|nr:unnamed protein product [Rotaria sp. Silwood2]CAF4063867.1 unnamed protein product [Rotaria sp. Silwood2]
MDKSIVKQCNTCEELAGFYCNGCQRIFCQRHANEHRQSLYEQLDWLTVDHDDFVNTLNSNESIAQRHSSSKKIIDKWEEESIKHIQKTANEARCALIDAIKNHINELKEKLKLLTEKLHEANHNNNNDNNNNTFDERNIKQWVTDLHNLKNEFIGQSRFTVRIHGNKPVVMPIIKIQPDPMRKNHSNKQQQQQQCSFGLVCIKNSFDSNESSSTNVQQDKPLTHVSVDHNLNLLSQKDDQFSICSDHVKILDNGQLVIHDSIKFDASIIGSHEYSQGEHKLFFHIEHMTSDEWIFFGIISKHTSLNEKSYMDSSVHGWAGYDNVYINGKSMPTLNGYLDNMKMNDFIELTIDCNKQRIFLWHSRQTCKNKLPVDIRACPFPWRFLISCHNPNDTIRILPSSMTSIIKQEQDKLNNTMKIKENGFKKEDNYFPIQWETNTTDTVQCI